METTHADFLSGQRGGRSKRDLADKISAMRANRARKACIDAGLDGNLLGIHPHNAMVSRHHGKPWPNVDYSKVRLCLRIMRDLPNPHDIVSAWDRRVRHCA